MFLIHMKQTTRQKGESMERDGVRGGLLCHHAILSRHLTMDLKLKPQTIYTWAQNGKIPAAKLGKKWGFKKPIIDKWFNQHIDVRFSEYLEL
jgi:excisionase family DNA binding protein